MKTIAFFNNKGGVGKTTLVYHLAHMLPRIGYPTLAVDLDPQANLTSAFIDEEGIECLWDAGNGTILTSVNPILEGTGDILAPEPRSMADGLWLIPGDLGLSRFEDKLSAAWPSCLLDDAAALRTTSAFFRLMNQAAGAVGADVTLVDVGPNLGAINRSALLATDHLVIPLAADLFSLQGLKNLGPTVRRWREHWTRVRQLAHVSFDLPEGAMEPVGYVVLQHAVRLDRPVRAFARWLERIPAVYRQAILDDDSPRRSLRGEDKHCLGSLRNFRSLMPMAQDARKPMFDLRPADGAIGSHAQLVQDCRDDFEKLARKLAGACDLSKHGQARAGA